MRSRGSIMIEVACTVPIFLVMVLLGIESVRIGFITASIRLAANNGARYAALNRSEPGLPSREHSIASVIARSTTVPLSLGTNIQICPAPQTSCGQSYAGGPMQFITINIRYTLRTAFGALAIPLRTTTVTRNEPFQ